MNTATTTHDFGNNSTRSTGAVKQADGTWLCLTFVDSKELKTERGAIAWLARRGYDADGSRLPQ